MKSKIAFAHRSIQQVFPPANVNMNPTTNFQVVPVTLQK